MHRQQLIRRLTEEKLNELLDRGARVVWLQRCDASAQLYDAVLETVKEVEFTREQAVLEFLAAINPQELERELANHEMDVPMGEAIQLTLAKWVTGGSA